MKLTAAEIEADAAQLHTKFITEWGAFRRFTSAHPLTSVILVALVVALVVGLIAFGLGRL